MIRSQNIYALIVGIEDYQLGSNLVGLDGSACDALRFCKWLKQKQVPSENICLFTSVLKDNQKQVNEELEKLDLTSQVASENNIYKAITAEIPKWGAKRREELKRNKEALLLYLYWSGHGVSKSLGDRRFFCEDGIGNLHLKNLITALKSVPYKEFQSQVFIFDACSVYYPKNAPRELKEVTYQPGDINFSCKQSLVFATREGQTAKNLTAEKTGLFTKILLEELENEDSFILPSTIDVLIDSVGKKLENDYHETEFPLVIQKTSKPEKLFYDEKLFEVYSNKKANYINLIESSWDELITILDKIDWQIISDCCNEILKKYCIDTYKTSYGLGNKNWESLKEILIAKVYLEKDDSNIPLMLIFAENISKKVTANTTLIDWKNKLAERLELSLEDIIEKSKIKSKKEIPVSCLELEPFLLIYLEELSSSSCEYKIGAELLFQTDHFTEVEEEQFFVDINISIVNKDNFCETIKNYLSECSRLLEDNPKELTIEVFMPKSCFYQWDFDNQIIPNQDEDPEWFGSKYKLITRYYDRCKDYSSRKDLKDNWKSFEDLISSMSNDTNDLEKDRVIQSKMMCLEPEDKKRRWRKLRRDIKKDNILGLNLDIPILEADYQEYHSGILESLSQCGLPFSFWVKNKKLCELKRDSEQEKATSNNFLDILKFKYFQNPDNLSEEIRNIRELSYIEEDDMTDYLGYHIGFLYDNPRRIPSSFDSEKGQDILVFENLTN